MKLKLCIPFLATCLLHHIAVQTHAGPPVLSAPDWTWPYFQFTVTGGFNVYHVVEASTNLEIWTPVLTNAGANSPSLMRVRAVGPNACYRVWELPLPLFAYAIAARGQINFNGNAVRIDSFDSSDPNFSTAGLYDPLKNKDSGNVATPFFLTNSLGIGNAKIMGRASTGPGGSVNIGPSGAIGSKAWIEAGQTGIQPGWWTTDMTRNFPDVPPPSTQGAFAPGSGTVNGTNYQYVLAGEKYLLSSLALGSTNKMRVIGNAILYVAGNVSITGTAFIEISPGATLKLFVGGPSALMGGNGIVNNAGSATNFQYYGLPSNTTLNLGGGKLFVGVIYAPGADFAISMGGAETYHFSGAVVAQTATVNGHCNFHYDENLLRAGLSP